MLRVTNIEAIPYCSNIGTIMTAFMTMLAIKNAPHSHCALRNVTTDSCNTAGNDSKWSESNDDACWLMDFITDVLLILMGVKMLLIRPMVWTSDLMKS